MSDVDVVKLLDTLAIKAKRAGSKWIAVCPNPNHPDKHPSWAIIDRPGDSKHGSHHCQSCKWGGGPWELAAAVWGCTVEEAGKRLGKARAPAPSKIVRVRVVSARADKPEFKLPLGVVIPEPGGRWYTPALEYLTVERRLPREWIDRWGFGYATRGDLCNRVVMPVRDAAGVLLQWQARAIVGSVEPRYDSGREHRGARARRALWGEQWWGAGIATLSEGIFGAAALALAGAPNSTALLGSRLTEEKALALSRFDGFIVATDPDPAGDAVARQIEIWGRRLPVYRLRMDGLKCDDAVGTDRLAEEVERARRFFP